MGNHYHFINSHRQPHYSFNFFRQPLQITDMYELNLSIGNFEVRRTSGNGRPQRSGSYLIDFEKSGQVILNTSQLLTYPHSQQSGISQLGRFQLSISGPVDGKTLSLFINKYSEMTGEFIGSIRLAPIGPYDLDNPYSSFGVSCWAPDAKFAIDSQNGNSRGEY